MMPEMDGYETCQHLKNNPATQSIPVIFVTAMSDVDDESHGFDVGAVDYITKPVSAPIVLSRVQTHLSLVHIDELQKSQRAAVYMLGEAGHYNDTNTGVHIWRMAAYSCAIAKAAGWKEDACALLELAAPMHDTGKIGIPDAILKKTEALDSDEWKIMRDHPAIGYRILSKGDTPLFKLAAEIARYHHEKWDGSGYLEGLIGKNIPESARIIAIADVFDALTMKRPYKPAWSIEDAAAEIENGTGKHFDPRMVKIFEAVLPELITIKNNWNQNTKTSLIL
jgi:putative two-component system response regulator